MKILITLGLFFLLIYLRIQVRILNLFSADELKEIGSLTSIPLLLKFLPTIPGGAPGDYLLVLPLNKLFPTNHYMLAIPGLISHLLVFILLPKVISKLNIVRQEYNFLTATVARLFFVFDPTLTFQSMEIRPYANLPLYWIANVFIVLGLFKLDSYKHPLKAKIPHFLYILLLTALFIWYYYIIIMFLSIYLFLIFRENGWKSLSKFYLRKSFYIIGVSTILAFPFWKYFSSQTGIFPYNTFGWLGTTVAQIYAIDKGEQHGLAWQNWIYFCFLLLIIVNFLINTFSYFRKNRTSVFRKNFNTFLTMDVFLVALPLAVIVILDVLTRYMFLYRQFVWIMLPFYIANAVTISYALGFISRIRKIYA